MNSDPDQHKIFTGTGTVEKIYPGPGHCKNLTRTGTGDRKILPGLDGDRDRKKVIL
jgi:hypothetical protein